MYEVFAETSSKVLEIDTLYILQNYADAFENGVFEDKWDVVGPCEYDGYFWGYNNVTAKEIICVRYQGKISKLWELFATHLSDKKVMIAHGEIPLHDTYGSKSFWDCRRSMKFNNNLIKAAENYISEHLKCNTRKCPNYVSIHWRRQDFARYRPKDVPSITGTAMQIEKSIRKVLLTTKKVFIASDAPSSELNELETKLRKLGLTAYFYVQNEEVADEYNDGFRRNESY
ncbi:O-fucosyltransferase 2 [Operophtera brumata]|uniref:GDP-fucose protein O-fucosyltransferase 2 n=1 Tax=Operophtera brumata TaxID=104452 RepID=A0A0L7LA31_OPEBR|nr:O-fucosyltransferase 2 [Operophtera brumata]